MIVGLRVFIDLSIDALKTTLKNFFYAKITFVERKVERQFNDSIEKHKKNINIKWMETPKKYVSKMPKYLYKNDFKNKDRGYCNAIELSFWYQLKIGHYIT